MIKFVGALSIATSLLFSVVVHGEVIKIPIGQQTANAGMSKPVLGMSVDEVLADYGEPSQRFSAVGEPPISRWVYPEFTVYFEYETVMHSVVKHKPKVQEEAGTLEEHGTLQNIE